MGDLGKILLPKCKKSPNLVTLELCSNLLNKICRIDGIHQNVVTS